MIVACLTPLNTLNRLTFQHTTHILPGRPDVFGVITLLLSSLPTQLPIRHLRLQLNHRWSTLDELYSFLQNYVDPEWAALECALSRRTPLQSVTFDFKSSNEVTDQEAEQVHDVFRTKFATLHRQGLLKVEVSSWRDWVLPEDERYFGTPPLSEFSLKRTLPRP